MITFIGVTTINLITWIPTIIKSKDKGRTSAIAAVTWALCLCTAAAVRYLLAA